MSHPDDPLRIPSWWTKSPSQKLDRVIESELAFAILYVMLHEQVIQLLSLIVILQIDLNELVALWQVIWLLLHFCDSLNLDRLVQGGGIILLVVLWHRLCGPKVMFIKERDDFVHLF